MKLPGLVGTCCLSRERFGFGAAHPNLKTLWASTSHKIWMSSLSRVGKVHYATPWLHGKAWKPLWTALKQQIRWFDQKIASKKASLTNLIQSINSTLSCNINKTCEGVVCAMRLVEWSNNEENKYKWRPIVCERWWIQSIKQLRLMRHKRNIITIAQPTPVPRSLPLVIANKSDVRALIWTSLSPNDLPKSNKWNFTVSEIFLNDFWLRLSSDESLRAVKTRKFATKRRF